MALVNSGYGVQNTFFTISKSTVLRQNVYKEYRFLIIKPTRCTNFSNLFLEWNSTCFRRFLCPSSGVFRCTHSNGICHTGLLTACEQDQDKTVTRCFSLYTQQWYTSYKFADTLRAGSGWNCHQMFFAVHTAMVYVIQVCWQLASRIRIKLSSDVFRCTHSNRIRHTGLLTACEQDQDKTVIRCFSLYTQQWYTSYRFADSLRAGSGWNCHQMFFAVHTAMVYVIQFCWQLASRIRMKLLSDVFHCTHSNGICHTGLLTACEQDQDKTVIRCFSLYTQQWYTSHRFADSLRAGSGWNCHQMFFAVRTAMVYVTQVCWQLASRIRMKLSSDVFHCTHSNGICHTGLLTACEQDQDKTVIRCFSLYTQQTYTSYRFADSLRAGSGWNCHQMFFAVHTAMVYVIQVCWQLARRIRMEPVPSWSCSQTCMSYTIAVCTVKNSWWWTEELSETCRVSFQK